MIRTSSEPTTTPTLQKPASNSLTIGLMPRWTWIVVAAAAAVLSAATTVVLSDQFNVVGWVVLAGALYIVGMHLTTMTLETRRRATDMLWK
ncbi:MAG: phosphate ABC transporter permease PstA, partial [Nesterenkonia sp.]